MVVVVGIVVVVGVVGSNLRRHVRGLIPKSLGGFSLWRRGGREVVGGFAWFGWFCFWRASVSPVLSQILAHSCPEIPISIHPDIDGLVLDLSISKICGLQFWEKNQSAAVNGLYGQFQVTHG